MVRIAATPVERLFWEYAADQRVELPADLVFARIMERGTIEDSRWLVRNQPRNVLRDWFQARAARHCSPKTLALWACILECPQPVSVAVPWRHDE